MGSSLSLASLCRSSLSVRPSFLVYNARECLAAFMCVTRSASPPLLENSSITLSLVPSGVWEGVPLGAEHLQSLEGQNPLASADRTTECESGAGGIEREWMGASSHVPLLSLHPASVSLWLHQPIERLCELIGSDS